MGKLLSRFFAGIGKMVFVFFGVATFSFILLALYPGSPLSSEGQINPVIKERLSEVYQLNEPLFVRYLFYMKNIFTGNLGESMNRPGKTVARLIQEGLPTSVALGFLALTLAVVGSLAFVFLSWRWRWGRNIFQIMTLTCISVPTLLLAPLMVLIFAVWLDWFPVALAESWQSYFLPVIVLSMRPMMNLARLLNKSMENQSHSLHCQFSRAMGFPEKEVLIRNVIRPSLAGYLAYLGPLSAGLLSGSLLVEMIFALPGLGTEYLTALVDRDYPLVIGLSLFYAALLIVGNFVTSRMQAVSDPRLRQARTG